jgi:hypothetical protein
MPSLRQKDISWFVQSTHLWRTIVLPTVRNSVTTRRKGYEIMNYFCNRDRDSSMIGHQIYSKDTYLATTRKGVQSK